MLIPLLGLKLAMIAAATADIALGVVLLGYTAEPSRRTTEWGMALVSAAIIAVTLKSAAFDPARLSSGVFRYGARLLQASDRRIVYYHDGKTASIAVTEDDRGVRTIATNGKPDAAIQMRSQGAESGDEATMILAGVLPLALHPNPENIANIGFGSGLTTHTLLTDPRVARVDTIEIERSMVEGAKAFRPVVERAYSDPRSHIYFDDAKTYFASHQSRYDVIVSEPSNPWVAGVGSLFSREFYRFATRHLNPGGLLVQWVQVYEINDELVGTIVNSLGSVFPDYLVYQATTSDLIIVARVDGPLPALNPGTMTLPGLRPLLARASIRSAEDLQLHELGDRATLAPFFAAISSRTNSDFFPVLSLEAPQARFVGDGADEIVTLSTGDLPLLEMLGGAKPPPTTEIQAAYWFLRSFRQVDAALIAAMLGGSNLASSEVDTETSGEIALLRGAGNCSAPVGTAAMIDTMIALAGRTIPLLPPAELHGAWIEPRWQNCPSMPQAARDMLALLAQLSARNVPAAQDLAVGILRDHRSEISDSTADYLVRAAMLCALAQGHADDAEAIFGAFGRTVPEAALRKQQVLYLLRYAHSMKRSAATPPR